MAGHAVNLEAAKEFDAAVLQFVENLPFSLGVIPPLH